MKLQQKKSPAHDKKAHKRLLLLLPSFPLNETKFSSIFDFHVRCEEAKNWSPGMCNSSIEIQFQAIKGFLKLKKDSIDLELASRCASIDIALWDAFQLERRSFHLMTTTDCRGRYRKWWRWNEQIHFSRRFMSDFSNSLPYRSLYSPLSLFLYDVMTFMNFCFLAASVLLSSYAPAFVGLAVDWRASHFMPLFRFWWIKS